MRTPSDVLFDRYVVVDWSASSRPTTGKDSIWFAVLDGSTGEIDLRNPATRREAEALLRSVIDDRVARTLIAVDAPLGYPAGAFDGADDSSVPWRSAWQAVSALLVDDETNANNRFEVAAELNRRLAVGAGPFWGRPGAHEVPGLAMTKPRPFTPEVDEFRQCERWLRGIGLRPASCWQLMGVGSVGSQTLTLLPILDRLLGDLGDDRCSVWPFSNGWGVPTVAPGGVVIAETWPTAFEVEYRVHWIRDAAQVHDVALALCAADAEGSLAAWFAPPRGLNGPGPSDAVEQSEGWALIPPR